MNIYEPDLARCGASRSGAVTAWPAADIRRRRIPEIVRRGRPPAATRCRCPDGCIHYSAGGRDEAMDTDVRSIRNCSVDSSAQFGRLCVGIGLRAVFLRSRCLCINATNGQVRARLRVDAQTRPPAPRIQLCRGRGSSRPARRRSAGRDGAVTTRRRAYERPRHATKITPTIASRPPHTVSMPGCSPVSAIDSSVATAGVR